MTFIKTLEELDKRIEAERNFQAFNKIVALYIGLSGDNEILHSFIQRTLNNVDKNNYTKQSLNICRDRLYSLLVAEAKKRFYGRWLKMILLELKNIRFDNLVNLERTYPHLSGEYWITAS